MAYVAVDGCGEIRCKHPLERFGRFWVYDLHENEQGQYDYETDELEYLEEGSIKKLIGRELTWDDEPVELTDKTE